MVRRYIRDCERVPGEQRGQVGAVGSVARAKGVGAEPAALPTTRRATAWRFQYVAKRSRWH